MNETEFHQLVDSQLERIETAIDEAGADIDYETSGNVMTLEFDDGSQIIINRQEPMREIWLASKSGGYHFKSIDGEWICSKTGLELLTLLKQECDKHADEPIDWV
ncbi:cyaY protein [Vibrio cholerae]|uniref:iron donor protein CyaY n=1 Tax=Vibrio cholerae TaxID=666 RepID=UPI0004E2FFB0|nr:iron donor protein CyaY [Vibrio cholerae]EGQ8444147.1 iron donor protein CyaY [Vibrio cholerae]EGQ8591932.1 iron donor protein CyaY [Vibrio cholerae]EGQ8661342.1 iron donor protein CyaY [Vibrio cholerae]EGQ9391893.1 iron donor protein CyaY [Vibrio cholerae]EGR0539022.1 iron donor protein CyaY [Vibrio cholerae]